MKLAAKEMEPRVEALAAELKLKKNETERDAQADATAREQEPGGKGRQVSGSWAVDATLRRGARALEQAQLQAAALALKAQEAMKLPNGCQGEDFRKVGDSFIVNILPNLSRKFENTREDPDVARHIIDRLPEELKTEGRNLLANLNSG